MDNGFDSSRIAARLRGLMADDLADPERTSRDLGVSEVALRMSIDELAPHPTLEVIVAAVRRYGVDPTWLITGEYDLGSHRALLSEEEDRDFPTEIATLIAKHLPEPPPPPQQPPLPS
jgi:hypothetical protein